MMSSTAMLPTRHFEPRGQTVSVIIFDQKERIIDELRACDDGLNESEVWLDFDNVETVGSAELGELIRFALRMRRLGKSVYACHVGAELDDIFRITRFHLTRIT